MIRFLIGIVVTIATFYIALIYESVALGLLGFCEAVLFVSVYIFLLWHSRKIHASIDVWSGFVTEEEKVKLVIRGENKSKLPCMKTCWRVCIRNTFAGKGQKGWYPGDVLYPGENQYSYRFKPQGAGFYHIELKKVRIYDMTGMFYLNRKCTGSAKFYVLPKIVDVGVRLSEQTRNFYGESDSYDDFHPGQDQSEIFDVREFRAGDRIQSIEWKLSAKQDQLYVREGSLPMACPVVLFLEASNRKKNYEDFLVVAAGISFSLMDAACHHYISWYSESRQDIVRYRVYDEESFYEFFAIYLTEKKSRGAESLEEMYNRKYPNDHAANRLMLKEDPILMQNGRVILDAGKDNIEEKLRNLELQL